MDKRLSLGSMCEAKVTLTETEESDFKDRILRSKTSALDFQNLEKIPVLNLNQNKSLHFKQHKTEKLRDLSTFSPNASFFPPLVG